MRKTWRNKGMQFDFPKLSQPWMTKKVLFFLVWILDESKNHKFFLSYLSLWQAWHLQPVTLSLEDLLTQTQHFRHTPKLQSTHSRRRLKSSENPSPQRAQIRWLRAFCLDMRFSTFLLSWVEAMSDSICLQIKSKGKNW